MPSQIDYAAEYNNSARVPDSDVIVNQYIVDATLYREHDPVNTDLDLSYGPEPRNRLDIFWPGEDRNCPMVVFIHGGYWQRLDRSSFSHMAQGLNERGIAVVLPSYTLCPDITIGGIINEMRRACILLYQTYERPLTVIGHSAGGHLAACMMATDWRDIHHELPDDLVQSGMGISGLYDLAPLIETPINIAVGLDEQQAAECSPVYWMPQPLAQFDAWVGGDESSEYHRQSRLLAGNWSMMATPTRCVEVEGANHFTIIHQLTDRYSEMVKRIVDLVRAPGSTRGALQPDEAAVEAALQDFAKPRSEKNSEKKDEADGEKADPSAKHQRPLDVEDTSNSPPARVEG